MKEIQQFPLYFLDCFTPQDDECLVNVMKFTVIATDFLYDVLRKLNFLDSKFSLRTIC